MTSRLRIRPPAGALWQARLNGAPHPHGDWVAVSPGSYEVELRAGIALPTGRGDVRLACRVVVAEHAALDLAWPWAATPQGPTASQS